MKMKNSRVPFIANNFEELINDIARGEGDFLQGLAYLSLCSKNSVAHFSQVIKGHTQDILNQKRDPKLIVNSIDEIIRKDRILNSSCLELPNA